MSGERQENMAFEDEVRRVAEAVWQLEPGFCQPAHYSNNPILHELDGIAPLRDITHLLMVTVSRRLDKIKGDIRKLEAASKIEAKRNVPVSMWIITKEQLDAEHITLAKSHGVTCLTLSNFRNRFFNGRDYLEKRRKTSFGSARNLGDGTISISEDEYVELPMLKRYHKEKTKLVPLAVNLREHWGQDYGDEILERHARSIGFFPKENLTIAWRAGNVILLLDGFDELASQGVARRDNLDFMKDARRQATQGIRDLIDKAPVGVGILICGRDHYFDGPAELIHSLGISNRSFSLVKLGEFSKEKAMQFLKKKSISAPLPDWLPRKPLILGYLAHTKLLSNILQIDSTQGFGYAWKEFLRLVCTREAAVERASMDPETVQRVLC